MRKTFILFMLALLLPLCALAQSSMTDDQVFRFIIKEHEAGTSQQQIVVQLMQRGVDITQIRRVRKKYERLAKEEGLGAVSNDTESGDDRTRNRKKQQQSQYQDSVLIASNHRGYKTRLAKMKNFQLIAADERHSDVFFW